MPSGKSILLVTAQVSLIAALLGTGPWWAKAPGFAALELAGIALGIWALAAMRASRFRVMPEVHPRALLVTAGPYRWIRHPMYSAGLLAMLALVLDAWSLGRFLVWLALLAVLVAKLLHEERLLAAAFSPYADYQRITKRLVPGLW